VNQKIIISLALTAALPILVGAIAQGAQPASAILPGDAAVTMKFAQHHRSLALWERVGVRKRSGARRHFIIRGGSARPMIVRMTLSRSSQCGVTPDTPSAAASESLPRCLL
jgi:hypothetical protein